MKVVVPGLEDQASLQERQRGKGSMRTHAPCCRRSVPASPQSSSMLKTAGRARKKELCPSIPVKVPVGLSAWDSLLVRRRGHPPAKVRTVRAINEMQIHLGETLLGSPVLKGLRKGSGGMVWSRGGGRSGGEGGASGGMVKGVDCGGAEGVEMPHKVWGRRTLRGQREEEDPDGRVTGAARGSPRRPPWRWAKIGVIKNAQVFFFGTHSYLPRHFLQGKWVGA